MDNLDIKILVNQLKSAYRKLKSHIYYDNYSQIQKFQLSEFEFENFGISFDENFNKEDFQSNFDNFFLNFADDLYNNFESVIEEIINKIDVISIPKHFLNENISDEIIANFNIMNNKLDKVHYFIDLPIKGHILGILWIIRCGYLLDDKLYPHCYGNRLNETFLEKVKNCEFDDFSPFLFKPYYKNYQSWRDNGLNSLDKILKDNKNAVMLSLDFKDYYYRSLIDFNDLKEDLIRTKNIVNETNKINLDIFDEKLTNFIKLIFEGYSEKFYRDISNKPLERTASNQKEYYKKLPMIPLGFLPSLIISNWNLQGFDKAILEEVHPFYYGRYVDDILIVLESHEKSDSFGISPIEELSLEKFLNKYFTPKSGYPLNYILKYYPKNSEEVKNSEEIIRVYNLPMHINYDNNDIKFYHYENLEIQKKKLRVYKFSNKCSDAIIKNFRKEIYKNSSEFRLMHSLEDIQENLVENLYKINYKESINKLNDINDVNINKYEISKILSRLNFASKNMFNERISEDIINEVKYAFQGKYIDFLILWEKLFSFLYINDRIDDINYLIEEIINDIDSIEFCIGLDLNKNNKSELWLWEDSYKFTLFSENLNKKFDFDQVLELNNLKKSLLNFLYASLIRVISLKSYSSKINFDIFKNRCNIFDSSSEEHIFNYRFSLMQNNSLMKYPLRNVWDISGEYDLIHQDNGFNELFNGIYPRFIKFNEFIFHEINNKVFDSSNSEDYDFEEYIQDSLENYNIHNFGKNSSYIHENLNYHCKLNCDNNVCNNKFKVLNVFSTKKDKIKIGLLNTKIFNKNLEKRLKNKPNLSFDRFDNIKYLINDAIKKDVELLLMPEMYIPYEWINEIVRVSKDHQMAIIFGVEPILNQNNVGNYIMASLPFLVKDKYQETVLIYRLKNHYAPFEFKTYKKYGKHPIKCKGSIYHLLIWNNIYIAPYYCFEIADVKDRSLFKSWCDIITVSEFNKDTKYFNSIAESLSRDLFCYCVKSNSSEFGGSVILQPSSSKNNYLVNLKGGEDDYIVTCNLNINRLREDAIKDDIYSDGYYYKPKPPGFDKEVIKKRMDFE